MNKSSKLPIGWPWILGGLLATFTILGVIVDDGEQPAPKPIVKTKVITKIETKKVEVPVVTKACKKLIAAAAVLGEAQIHANDSVDESLDAVTRARSAILTHDTATLNESDTQIRKLQTKTEDARLAIITAQGNFDAASKSCPEGQ